MKDAIESFFGYVIITFLYFCSAVFGIERVKKFGYYLIKKYEDKP